MELLKRLYEIHSPSTKEDEMISFISDWLAENVPTANVCVKDNNVYVTKGISETYPCVVAHTDQVQDYYGKDYTVYNQGDTIFAFSEEVGQQGLGADDKNGIWVALNLLFEYDVCKAAFFNGEEIGCIGSSCADMEFFNDCRFVLQCDRRGSSDFIANACGVTLCSDKFIKDCGIDKYGYSEAYGSVTDVMTLKERGLYVSACNISCGYHAPHTQQEITKFSELKNCLNLCEHIFDTCTEVYPHLYVCKRGNSLSGQSGFYFGGNDFYTSTHENPSVEELADILYDDLMFGGEYLDRTPSEREIVELYSKCGYKKKDIRKAYKMVMSF